MRILLNIGLIFGLFLFAKAGDDFSQWRGPNRDGKYPDKDLLKKWPENGPALVWQNDNIGIGHSSAAVTNDRVYITGMRDKEGILFCFDHAGALLWEKSFGPVWHKNYPGTRSTPTVVDNDLYLISGQGLVVCFNAVTGLKRWSVNILKEFDSENIVWGMNESPLIIGDLLICTPGGRKDNIVALNRFNGQTVWISEGNGEPSAYCSPQLANHNGKQLIVTMTTHSILAIDAKDGTVYWRVPHHQEYEIHANTPIYHEGKVFCLSGSPESSAAVLLKLSMDGKKVEQVWQTQEADNLIGGVILFDGYLYSSRYKRGEWFCLNWETGKVEYISREIDGGPIISADGLFYCYSENGYLSLVKADSKNFEIISTFKIKFGKGPHWSHPVIANGRLYLRHGEVLRVYNISKKK